MEEKKPERETGGEERNKSNQSRKRLCSLAYERTDRVVQGGGDGYVQGAPHRKLKRPFFFLPLLPQISVISSSSFTSALAPAPAVAVVTGCPFPTFKFPFGNC